AHPLARVRRGHDPGVRDVRGRPGPAPAGPAGHRPHDRRWIKPAGKVQRTGMLVRDMSMPEPPPFAEFYGAHFQRIAVQLYAYLGDHAEAQDLTQEAFCRALERWPAVSRYADPAAWVRHVA